jgi:hypothetical protein
MGNILPTSDGEPHKTTYLYEVSHDLITDNYDRKNSILFTNLLGVFCHLEYSKHKKDRNIKIIVYRNEINLYQLDDDQTTGVMLTVFPSLDEEFKEPKNALCEKLHRLTSKKLNIEEVNVINKTYGSYLYVNKNKLSICEHIIVEDVYDLDVSKITETVKEAIQNSSEMNKIEYLKNNGIIVKNDVDKKNVQLHLLDIVKKTTRPATDGRRKKSKRKKSKRNLKKN